ncbi:MAG: hypothetical protein NTW21_43560 [Verrucomicrobia bacterium]|nr:hypothetical protein [Verrucomicrobiota bacterium]
MKFFILRIMRRIRRVREAIYSRKRFLVYSIDLKITDGSSCSAKVPIEFHINEPEAFTILRARGGEYEIDERIAAEIDRQLMEGEVCVSGWVQGELAYYVWIQFKQRLLTRKTTLPIPAGTAFIYRGFTRADFRGKHIHPAALNFTCRWLADRGYQRALVDHQVGNSVSQSGILRAGMQPAAEYVVIRMLWLRWAIPDAALLRLASNA